MNKNQIKGTILVVEDDENISRLLKYNLEKAGFKSLVFDNGEDALDYLEHKPADLIILDVMLPGIDGFEVCRQIRQERETLNLPVIMLTAKGEEIDRVLGFELGADDYVVKPFSPRELILRVRAVMKRKKSAESTDDICTAGILTVDIARHRVTLAKKEIDLTAMEFDLLAKLIQRRGRVQSRDILLEDVWDLSSTIATRTVDTHIKRLRQKLGKAGKYIETVRGVGYRFKEED